MDQRMNRIFFALLRSAIGGFGLTSEERADFEPEMTATLMRSASKHDLGHLIAHALKKEGLLEDNGGETEKQILLAIYRYQRLNYEYGRLRRSLEEARIPFLPLKGSILRNYYPEPWMRTSCDIDVLVKKEDLERAISLLKEKNGYTESGRATHDVSFYSENGTHVELHFDLVEEGRANDSIEVLSTVWQDAAPADGSDYRYEMSDSFFYLYHIAHMAKHFETGGCGVRPFVDLWILDALEGADIAARRSLLERAGLLRFCEACRALSRVWLGGAERDVTCDKLERFILSGGIYGTTANKVALQQKKRGGRLGYLISRIFIPFAKLKRYYPVLEKHPWLMPAMQVRRWFMLLDPRVRRMAKSELASNKVTDRETAEEMNLLLESIGLK